MSEAIMTPPDPHTGTTADDYDDDFDQDDCWNCGGEGFVSSCFEEYACLDPEAGCDLCTRRCEYCKPARLVQGDGGEG